VECSCNDALKDLLEVSGRLRGLGRPASAVAASGGVIVELDVASRLPRVGDDATQSAHGAPLPVHRAAARRRRRAAVPRSACSRHPSSHRTTETLQAINYTVRLKKEPIFFCEHRFQYLTETGEFLFTYIKESIG